MYVNKIIPLICVHGECISSFYKRIYLFSKTCLELILPVKLVINGGEYSECGDSTVKLISKFI